MPKPKPYNSRQITQHLRELAAEAQDWSEEDGVLTKGECLARLLWRKALGWEERTLDDEGAERIVKHPPEAWAIQLIYDRMEGKVPQAAETEGDRRMTAASKVRELAASQVSSLAREITGGGPPKHRPKKD